VNIFQKGLTKPYLGLLLAIICILLSRSALWQGWFLEDYLHRLMLSGGFGLPPVASHPIWTFFTIADGEAEHTRMLMDIGCLPWWTYEYLKISFWRPLAVITHIFDYSLYPDNVFIMHFHNLLWLGAVVIAAAFLYRRIMGVSVASGLAALFYALEDSHVMSAAWLAGRNTMMAAFFGILTIIFHDIWRKNNNRKYMFGAGLLFGLALLSGEIASSVLAYILAHVLFLDKAGRRGKLSALVPYAVVFLGWWIVYVSLGYGVSGTDIYFNPLQLQFWLKAPERWLILLSAQLGPALELYRFLPGDYVKYIPAICILALIVIGIYPLLKKEPAARFWATGMALSLFLICLSRPGSRHLIFSALGGMALTALFISGVATRSEWLPNSKGWLYFAKVTGVIIIVIHVLAAAILFPLRIQTISRTNSRIKQQAVAPPLPRSVDNKSLVILNTPSLLVSGYMIINRAIEKKPLPENTVVICDNVGPMQLSRPDANTLVIQSERGFFRVAKNLFRARGHPMKEGQIVRLEGVEIRVMEIGERNQVKKACFTFPSLLEDSSRIWLRWKSGGFVFYNPPQVGETDVIYP